MRPSERICPNGREKVAELRTQIQLTLALCGLAVGVVAALAGLAYLKYKSILSESVTERIEILATTLARDFGSTVGLGLSLSELANGAEILNRASRVDQDIATILVFGPAGDVLYAAGEAPAAVDPRAIANLTDAGGWRNETPASLDVVRPIVGSFGGAVGGVQVGYPTALLRAQEATMRGRLLLTGGLVAAGMAALTVALVGVAMRGRAAV